MKKTRSTRVSRMNVVRTAGGVQIGIATYTTEEAYNQLERLRGAIQFVETRAARTELKQQIRLFERALGIRQTS